MKLAILSLALLAATPAFAVDLSVDLTVPIKTVLGTQRKECVEMADQSDPAKGCKTYRDMTAGDAIAESLAAPDRAVGADQAVKNGALAIQIAAGAKTMNLTPEQITQIKNQAAKFEDPVTAAQIWELVQPGSTSK